ncbi:NAD(P)-binding protein [Lophiostoma macrostomum CBS 122681]|uniref:NAD(P)-binding protein n=1 Tax=Lophiostoma macrostomum CBS 122681 TaxID=1314788 RepID=A0A6A6TE21_9PLEO|nr:NAD(P)-binding protein [Lophiostoma macrostomum CBS 122681]
MSFLNAQFTTITPITLVNLSGRTVLITGANTGIGLETAREILKSKPRRLILAVRNLQKGNAAAMSLRSSKQSLGNTETHVEVRELDMADNKSVRRFVDGLEGARVDFAVLNAGIVNMHVGIWTMKWQQNTSGTELDLQVNVLGPALLSLLLLPNLRLAARQHKPGSETPKSHLTFVSSGLHARARFSERGLPEGSILAALNDREKRDQGFDSTEQYATSKLLNLLWAREFAKRVGNADVIVNAPNPGFCKTGLQRDTAGMMRYVKLVVAAILGRRVEDGARCVVDAVLVKGEESHGKYLSEAQVTDEVEGIRGDEGVELQRRVWDEVTAWLKSEGAVEDGELV